MAWRYVVTGAAGFIGRNIVAELNEVQGKAVDIGGYYRPDFAKLDAVMRPSKLFNETLATLD